MKIKDSEILIIPGLGNASAFHWQSRWQDKMSTARRVEQDDWDSPNMQAWTDRLVEAVEATEKPAILVAHSVGVLTVAHAAPRLDASRIAGAFLVGASDWERDSLEERFPGHGFAPVPRQPLGFKGLMLASSNDETCSIDKAEHWARDWDVRFGDAGEAGHFTEQSGHGPWPEGLMAFAKFTQSL
ncbi:MAG: alpha/beta hydrolase [Pseudomonadota bacterium]|nr:alpha/beta hydrolase [Pseudomonadota bacterium]